MSAVTHICPECNGKRVVQPIAPGFCPPQCPNCDGLGALDDNGEPINLDYVEYLKDECDECANNNSTMKSPESFRS